MGAVLALYLAAHHPELAGAITYSPAVMLASRLIYLSPVLKYVVRQWPTGGDSDLTDPQAAQRLWGYDEIPIVAAHELLKLILRVRRLLLRLTCPLLIIYSVLDRSIHPNSARYTYERSGSTDKELVVLHNSGHGLTVDSEWKFVAEKTYQFILARLPTGARAEG
jgi:carboxylesterase